MEIKYLNINANSSGYACDEEADSVVVMGSFDGVVVMKSAELADYLSGSVYMVYACAVTVAIWVLYVLL